MSKTRVPRLGRGLSSLLAQPVSVEPPAPKETPDRSEVAAPEVPAQTATALDPAPSNPASPELAAGAPGPDPAAAGRLAPAATLPPSPAAANAAASASTTATPVTTPAAAGESVDVLRYLPLDTIEPNPHQPRQHIDPAALQQLANSIRQDGVIQPIVVRPGLAGGRYTLVAGERRWRAARLAGLDRVPALIRTLSDRDLAQWALIENLQREDLNPIERAHAFQHLIDRFAMSHEQVAEHVGVERSTISNSLRLLNLCDNVQGWVIEGRLSAGHARALAGVADLQRQMLLAQRVIREDWSVRKLEAVLRQEAEAAASPAGAKPNARANHLADLEQQIARQLGTKVRLRPGRKKGTGTLAIEFYSIEQFDALMGRLNVQTE